MANQDRAGQLADAVAIVLALHGTKFRQCWDLYLQTAEISEIQGLFVRIDEDPPYFNIAIAGEGIVADIEGADGQNPGVVRIYRVSLIREVILHRGSLPSYDHSKGASLMLLLRLVGLDESGPYWAARTQDEEEQLLSFARCLVQCISTK